MRHNPHLDALIVADRPRGLRRVAYDVALARRLRAARFDLVIDFHGGPRSAWLTWATRAQQRIGYDVPGRRWMYTTRVRWSRALVPPRHSVETQWDLLAPLGIGPASREAYPVQMIADSDAVRAVDQRLGESGVPADARLVVLHVSASSAYRRWPRERFADVAATLAHDGCHVIITSGPSERDAADGTASTARTLAGAAAARILRCGEFNLPELRALIDRARLFIGGDSGPLHIAATTRTPVVALFGPTVPARSMPWRDPSIPALSVDAGPLPCRPCDQRTCIPGDFRCLNNITTESVVTAARQLLAVT